MSKNTNKKQLDVLLSTMQTYPGVACGMFKGSKEELNRVWRNLEAELNSAGPPSKSIAEWKKVWSDQKKYVRHKASQNLKHAKGTGGGPNMTQKLSPNEEAIYHLIGTKESVEGVANTFGLNSIISTSLKEYDENVPPTLQEFKLVDDVVENCVHESDQFRIEQPSAKKVKRDGLSTNVSPSDVLAEEIILQKKMLEVMQEQQQGIKKIYRSIDRLCELKKRELEDQKRHNLIMEKLRLKEVEDKIEKNRRLLELEELKHMQ